MHQETNPEHRRGDDNKFSFKSLVTVLKKTVVGSAILSTFVVWHWFHHDYRFSGFHGRWQNRAAYKSISLLTVSGDRFVRVKPFLYHQTRYFLSDTCFFYRLFCFLRDAALQLYYQLIFSQPHMRLRFVQRRTEPMLKPLLPMAVKRSRTKEKLAGASTILQPSSQIFAFNQCRLNLRFSVRMFFSFLSTFSFWQVLYTFSKIMKKWSI